jgi:hypothetical protein
LIRAWPSAASKGRPGCRIRITEKERAMAERSRTRRNTLERRCLGKAYKRLFVGSSKGIFKMLEKIKKA